MINDEFSAVVHGEYRRHELLAAVTRHPTMLRRPGGFGAYHIRSLFRRIQRVIGRGPRVSLHATKP